MKPEKVEYRQKVLEDSSHLDVTVLSATYNKRKVKVMEIQGYTARPYFINKSSNKIYNTFDAALKG